MAFVKVASVGDMQDGEAKAIEVNGEPVALYRAGGEFFATSNTCVHKGGPLGEGALDGCVITCPWHGWRFDVKTGVSPVNPAAKVRTFRVKIEGEDVLVDTDQPAEGGAARSEGPFVSG